MDGEKRDGLGRNTPGLEIDNDQDWIAWGDENLQIQSQIDQSGRNEEQYNRKSLFTCANTEPTCE